MKKIACLICLTLLFGHPLSASSQDKSGGVRIRISDTRGNPLKDETLLYSTSYALLIGNTKYQDRAWNDLPDVDDDLIAVREVLEKQHGFKVEVALNQNRDSLLRVIDQFINKYGQRLDSRLLIYYSGHGYTALLPDERKMGYLVLPGAPDMPDEEKALRIPPTDEEFERFLPAVITMDEIETYARRITAKHVLFVFDSCFSGTALYKDLGIGVPTLITSEELKSVRAYLTAGNETQRVPAFSKFRRKFVAGLMGEADVNGDGYILSSELGRWVSIEVEKDTGRKQTPVFGKLDMFNRGDVIFVSPKKVNQAIVDTRSQASLLNPKPISSIESKTGEQLFWQEMEKRNTIGAYQNYLAEYPNGDFARIAKLRLASLKWTAFQPIAKQILKYYWIQSFSEGLAAVNDGDWYRGKWGFIDHTGKEAIPPKYDLIWSFSEGLALVKLNNQLSFIDKTGKEIILVKYDLAESFSEGLARVSMGNIGTGKNGFIDKNGKEVIPLKYDFARPFSEGLAAVKLNDKYGYIDHTGRVVIPLKYDFVDSFKDGFARVDLNDKDILIDKIGNKVMTLKYDPLWSFSEGLASVRLNRKYGFIDRTGNVIIPLKYDFVESFKDGFAKVRIGDYQNGKYGFIDNTGKQITSNKYNNVESFSDGLATVWLNNKAGFIDKTGKEVTQLKYDSVWCEAFRKDGFIGVKLNGRKGFVDIYGNEYFDFQ